MDTETYVSKLAILLNLENSEKEKLKQKIEQQQAESPTTEQQS